MVEQILEDFDRAYGLKSVCLRYFNAAGADPKGDLGERHDPETHLIPLILQAISGRRDSFQFLAEIMKPKTELVFAIISMLVTYVMHIGWL